MYRRMGELLRQKDFSRVPKIQSGSTVRDALIRLDYYDSGALPALSGGKPG